MLPHAAATFPVTPDAYRRWSHGFPTAWQRTTRAAAVSPRNDPRRTQQKTLVLRREAAMALAIVEQGFLSLEQGWYGMGDLARGWNSSWAAPLVLVVRPETPSATQADQEGYLLHFDKTDIKGLGGSFCILTLPALGAICRGWFIFSLPFLASRERKRNPTSSHFHSSPTPPPDLPPGRVPFDTHELADGIPVTYMGGIDGRYWPPLVHTAPTRRISRLGLSNGLPTGLAKQCFVGVA
ncbi:hypothetical protein CT0861_09162 [Colletotrichum tofieldiae]|uniref:Uncharacterized protein n=1 Tax=Colletotrichum tofieldiae TaxID=708197 RepID=A0A166V300_9PEZI|nr:hypothetical protein CT0861_09162 [Colletotrichum tofieldiae]